jgi:hypothetical protein
MQSKKNSAIEIAINVGSGYFVGILVQLLIFPYFGLDVSLADNALITLCFTIASFIRGYIVRRIFNKYGIDN